MKVSCTRCGVVPRRTRGWNVDVRQGVVVAIVCPGCQTAEENAEAEVREATTIYGTNAFGLLTGRPKGV